MSGLPRQRGTTHVCWYMSSVAISEFRPPAGAIESQPAARGLPRGLPGRAANREMHDPPSTKPPMCVCQDT